MKKTINKVFVPNKQLNPRPLFWHPFSITFFILILFFISSFLTLERLEDSNPESLLGDIRTGIVVSLTNKERENAKLPALTQNEILDKAAKLKAEDMASKGYFSHYSPTGESPWFWLEKVGYEYNKAGENLAVNFDDSKDVVNAWMDSPSHKENIIKDGYLEVGVGTAEGFYKGKKATFVVQLFGTPKSDFNQFAFALEKKSTLQNDSLSSVRGAEISLFSLNNFTYVFSSETNILMVILLIILLISIFAIIICLFKIKHISKKILYYMIILLLVFITALLAELFYIKNIVIHLI